MAGRLTIRRVGHILPTLCLVVLLLLLGIITWLSTAGLPDAALRRIEQEVTKATGLPIQISKIKLSPRSGLSLKAEDTCLTLPQQDAPAATIRIRKTQVTFSITRLLSGDFRPAHLQVLRLQAELPLSDARNDSIILSPLNLYINLPGSKSAVRAELNAQLQGISLQGKLSLASLPTFSDAADTSDAGDTDTQEALKETLAEIRPWLRDFKQLVDKQKWEQAPPHLNISAAYNQEWKLSLEAQVPSCILGNFHFTEAQLKSSFEKSELRIHDLSFRTVSPESSVQLQASYDTRSRELSFASTSSAPFVQIVNDYFEAEDLPIISNLRSREGNTPRIELNGSASFSEDFALNSITVRGLLEQKGLVFGNVEANHLLLTFFLRDGSFNLDQCRIDFPNGHLQGAAQAANGTGRAELQLSLPAETILNLARNITGDSTLSLPDGLSFNGNLEAHLGCEMKTQPFEAGKSRLEDLVPTLSNCELQFRTEDITLHETQILSPSLHLKLAGIDYQDDFNVAQASLRIKAESAREKEEQIALDLVNLDLQLAQIHADRALTALQLGRTELKLQTGALQLLNTSLNDLDLHTCMDKLELEFNQPVESLATSALDLQADLKHLEVDKTSAEGISLKVNIPTGLDVSETWHSMQHDTHALATIQRLSGADNFSATDTRLELRNNGRNSMQLQLTSNLGEKLLELCTSALLTEKNLLQLSGIRLQLPASELRPLLGGEPLQELRLPKQLNLQGDALIDPESGRVLNSHFNLQVPELVRVCNNVFVHKGMEIPLKLDIAGDFATAGNGDMVYQADITATHADGTLDIHVTGNPLKECRITGTNTIPVSTVNALIDDADAHWIMRDFRCVPGVTRNVITDIDTTIRYDRGIYVRSLCKANLYNMDFQLGAIRDKEDAQGNPTGEEFLRTDLGRDPFTRIKEGHCDVEVIVQLDCTDAEGKALADIIDINLLNPDLLYDNRPWLRHAGIRKGAATSRITGEAVRFDIEKCIISLHKLKGSCYPAYAIGMYYAPLHDFLADIVLEKPADIETDYCVFPISSSCQVPMQGLIRAASHKGPDSNSSAPPFRCVTSADSSTSAIRTFILTGSTPRAGAVC